MNDLLKTITYTGIFAVPFVVLLITESLFFPYITGKNFTFRILVEVMTVAWILLAFLDAQYRPKFSWISVSMLGFLVIVFFANLFGEYPAKSFWSNFERMEGFVTIVHFYLYFLVVGAMLTTERLWNRFFNTTLAVAAIVSFIALAQISGAATVSQGASWRVDGTFGNSTYMAIYMLFHVFIAACMLARTRIIQLRYLYGGLMGIFVLMLLQTGTRGTALGLIGGVLLTTLYVLIYARGHERLRKAAAGALLLIAVVIGGFIAVRDSAFVQEVPVLDRLANISLSEGSIRFIIWNMALQGASDRPILGWGQENFSYVFNTYYEPELYRAEAWYDRVHNVFLDWLIAAGVFGLLAYVSIFLGALYYLLVVPLRTEEGKRAQHEMFSVFERALLVGILGGYTIHNIFVFDNLVSYIFFAVVLAFIHQQVARPIGWMEHLRVDRALIEKVGVPVCVIALVVIVYFVNVPGIKTAYALLGALRTTDHEERVEAFEQALSYDTFGTQEIVEQMSEYGMQVAISSSLSESKKEAYLEKTEEVLLAFIEEKPNDPRSNIFLAGMYRNMNRMDDAAAQLARARELSPRKGSIIIEQGILELQRGEIETARAYFKEAFDATPEYPRARSVYAGTALYEGATAEDIAALITEPYMRTFAQDVVVLYSIQQNQALEPVATFFERYIAEHGESMTPRLAYAQLFYGFGQPSLAIAVLEKAREEVPAFTDYASCYITTIRDGKALGDGCVQF